MLVGKTAVKQVNYTYAWVQEVMAARVLNGLRGIVEFDLAPQVTNLASKQLHMKACTWSLRDHFKKLRDCAVDGRCARALAPSVFAMFGDIARGLESVHSKFLVHADATSRNIFVAAPGATRGRTRFEARLGDLGIAAPVGHAHVSYTPVPYRERQVASDCAHDIFTAGVVFLEILGDRNLEPRVHDYDELREAAYQVCAYNGFGERVAMFLARMTSSVRQQRPVAAEVAHFFETLAAASADADNRYAASHRAAASLAADEVAEEEAAAPVTAYVDENGNEYLVESDGRGSPTLAAPASAHQAHQAHRASATLASSALSAQEEDHRRRTRVKFEAAQHDKDAQMAESARQMMRVGTTGEYFYTERVMRMLAANVRRAEQWHEPITECLGPLSVLIGTMELAYQKQVRAYQRALDRQRLKQKGGGQRSSPTGGAVDLSLLGPQPQPPPSLECWGAAAVYVIACIYGPEYFQRLQAQDWCARESSDGDGVAGFREAVQHMSESYPVAAHVLLTHLRP
jgi:hypothetical protein